MCHAVLVGAGHGRIAQVGTEDLTVETLRACLTLRRWAGTCRVSGLLVNTMADAPHRTGVLAP